jgi:26S proteasome regulatory subunit T1
MFKRLGYGPYTQKLKDIETQNKDLVDEIKKLIGVKESDTGLALPSQWNLAEDS